MVNIFEITFICDLIIFIFGICIGSFLNVVIYRLPHQESIAAGHSHCTSCGHTLAWYDLFPLFSYLFLRGRCRYCQAKISFRYPAVEFLTGALFVLVFMKYGLTLALLKYLFLSALLIAVAFIDIDTYIIPNSLVLTGLVGGVLLSLLTRDVTPLAAILGLAITGGFLLLVVMISNGGMGGGDMKLAAVTGLFLGWPLGPLGLFLGICTGGIYSIFLLISGKKGRKDPIPFGPFIVLGTVISMLCGQGLLAWYFNLL